MNCVEMLGVLGFRDIFVMFVKFLGCVSKTMTFATGVKMKLVAKMEFVTNCVFCLKFYSKMCGVFQNLSSF